MAWGKYTILSRFGQIMRYNFNEDHEWERLMKNLTSVMLPTQWDGKPKR